MSRKKIIALGVLGVFALVVIVLVILTGPWWHWFFYGLWASPAWLTALVFGSIIGAAAFLVSKSRGKSKSRAVGIVLGILSFFVLWLLFLIPLTIYPLEDLAQETLSRCRTVTEMPATTIPRTIPRSVAQKFAANSLQYPEYEIGQGYISYKGEKPYWSFPIVPNGFNTFFLNVKGVLYVDMTTVKKETRMIESEMKAGPGLWGDRDWFWIASKINYWQEYEDARIFEYGNSLYLMAPVIQREWRFRFPVFYTIKKWGGVALMDSNGKMEFLSPEQAQADPVLADQKIYPEYLTRYYIESLAYVHGWMNAAFFHKDQPDIAAMPEEENQQPFLINTEKGTKWMTACNPGGSTAGIYRIFLTDARNGDIEAFSYPANEALLGPVSACEYIQKNNPQVDWSQMTLSEPIPVIKEGNRLFWEIRVIPYSGAGISYVGFVDAKNNDVVEAKTDEEIARFIMGDAAVNRRERDQGRPAAKEVMTITIQNGDGSKTVVPVFEGSKVIIETRM